MEQHALSRWQQFYLDNAKLGDIPSSTCAKKAVEIFAEYNSLTILDLGCGTGRDSLCLARGGAHVVGLDAAHSGLLLAQKRTSALQLRASWVESDARFLPFSEAIFDGVYCFGLLHEFVGESSEFDVRKTMGEIYRVLKTSGVAVIATVTGDPEKGLPYVQNFTEDMFDAATGEFHCVERKMYDDMGCTGRIDYKVWFGHFVKR